MLRISFFERGTGYILWFLSTTLLFATKQLHLERHTFSKMYLSLKNKLWCVVSSFFWTIVLSHLFQSKHEGEYFRHARYIQKKREKKCFFLLRTFLLKLRFQGVQCNSPALWSLLKRIVAFFCSLRVFGLGAQPTRNFECV